MIHGHYPDAPKPRFNPDESGLPITLLERRMREDYRDHLQATFTEAGYSGVVAWPDLSTTIKADEEIAAVFVLSFLSAPLRKAVARFTRPGVAMVDLWRSVLPWRLRSRRRLLDVANELHCSGWQPFDIWLANRIAPDRCYPDGIVSLPRLRRPLPEAGWFLPCWPEDQDRQRRFDGLPSLSQEAYALFHGYGRNSPEIATRLGISRRSVSRRLRRVLYVVAGWPVPSLPWSISFHLRMGWGYRAGQVRRAWSALRG